jgi:hypothetical protein
VGHYIDSCILEINYSFPQSWIVTYSHWHDSAMCCRSENLQYCPTFEFVFTEVNFCVQDETVTDDEVWESTDEAWGDDSEQIANVICLLFE